MPTWLVERDGSREAVNSLTSLRNNLTTLADQDYSSMELIHESGDILSIFVTGPYALVKFTAGSFEPPYLTASMGNKQDTYDYYEFIIDDTPTPVLRNFCIPIEIAFKIVEYYFANGSLPDWVEWIED